MWRKKRRRRAWRRFVCPRAGVEIG
jgi:hypothetical protein